VIVSLFYVPGRSLIWPTPTMPGIPDSFDNPFARKVLMYTGQIACESSKDREDQSGGVQNPSRSQDLSPGRVAVPPRALIFPLPWHSLHYELFILFISALPRKHRYRELGGEREKRGKSKPNPENVAKVEYLTSSQ